MRSTDIFISWMKNSGLHQTLIEGCDSWNCVFSGNNHPILLWIDPQIPWMDRFANGIPSFLCRKRKLHPYFYMSLWDYTNVASFVTTLKFKVINPVLQYWGLDKGWQFTGSITSEDEIPNRKRVDKPETDSISCHRFGHVSHMENSRLPRVLHSREFAW